MTASLSLGTRSVEVSNPDKLLFPDDGVTKADLVAYYRRVAPYMLPHVCGRAVAMQRFPDGINAEGFLHKSAPAHFPEFVPRAALAKQDGATDYVVIDDGDTLAYLATQACITPHVWLSRAGRPNHPDRVIFDLDPGDAGMETLCETAHAFRELLADVNLAAFVKSTGSAGVHVEVPLDASADFDEVRATARAIAAVVTERDPDRVTMAHRKRERGGRLFVDTYRNAYAQHAVAPYALRARRSAPVAAPLDWHELTPARFHPQRYTLANLFRRLAQKRDPWEGFDAAAADVAAVRGRLPS